MKKITAFFMALFPFLVIGVLFATGLISKNFSDKIVQRLEMKQDIVKVQKETNDKMDYDISGNVRVLPDIVRDPTVYWTTDDASLASVEKETGKVTINELGYGDIKLHAVAKTNAAAKADCTLQVWDDKIHAINVLNAKQAEFVSPGSQLVLTTQTIPSENIKNPNLKFSIEQKVGSSISVTPNTGIVTVDANANTSDEAVITVEPEVQSETGPKVSTTVTVKVQNSIDAIGFDDDGDTLIQEGEYDLYSHVLTSPFQGTLEAKDYFKFYSSDESQAKIDENGKITFQKDYVPGNFIEFTVKFNDLDAISCKKRVASSMNYYSNVSFNGGYAKNIVLDSTNDTDITDQVTYTTFPVNGDKSRISLSSSDISVVEIKGDKIIAHKPGKATITVSAKVTSTSSISDKIDLTILNKNQRILNETYLDIGNTYYYPLRKSLSDLFKNKNFNGGWSVTEGSDIVIFDKNDETVFFKEPGKCKIAVTYTEKGQTWSDSIELECKYSGVDTLAIDAENAQIEVGKKFSVTEDSNPVTLTELPSSIQTISSGVYMATAGCKDSAFSVKTSTGNTYSLMVSQNVEAFTTDVDWTHYTTNATKVETASRISVYPKNATYITTTWTGEVKPSSPTVKYEFTPEDESAVDVGTDKTLTFTKPTTVDIKVSVDEVKFNYSVTSYCGGNGKFHLSDPTTNSVVDSGDTLSVAPGATLTYTIDEFYLSEVDVSTQLDAFTISAFSKNDDQEEKIVTTDKKLVDGKIVFTITGKSAGTDTVEISNGSYTMYLNVNVEKAFTYLDLYCLGNKLTKYDETTKNVINAYSKEKLVLNMDFSPVVCRDTDLTITFNDKEFTQKPGVLNLSENAEKGITWKDTDNTLIIKAGDKLLATYKFNLVTTTPADFSIAESHKEGDVDYLFLPAVSKGNYNVMTVKVDNAVFNQDYIKEKMTTTGFAEQPTIVGRYIIAKSPECGGQQQVTLTCGSASHNYTVKRDMVAKIVLPKHDNLDESDAKGLQRVHVYGTQSQYPNETKSDVYKLPITLYDGATQEITGDAKTKAIATLTPKLDGITSAVYNPTSGCYEVKFAKDANHIYTRRQIFNNEFANEDTNKNQLFSISTDYGKYHLDTDAFAFYSFVVVDGVNVWDQKGITDLLAPSVKIDGRNAVLQTNFGFDGMKESTPWTYTDWVEIREIYGNGYGMNWEVYTKAHIEEENPSIHIHNIFNTQMVGCNEDTFLTLKKRSCTLSFSEANEEENEELCAYDTFSNFFQPLTVCSHDSGQDDYYFHIKNSLFFNQKEKCRVAMSISNPKCYCTIEDCAFFNSSKIAMLVNKEATVRFKGDIDVYNFHGSDLFDALGWDAQVSEWVWGKIEGVLDDAHLLQGSDYGPTTKKVVNAYLFTALTGYVQFYDHTDASGKDIYIESQHGSAKAANYLRYGTGVSFLGQDLVDIWSTVKPPLPLQFGHAPAISDEFIDTPEGVVLNTDVRNLLIQKITRW